MTDLDFDELDKAVNNLMGSKEQPPESGAPTPAPVPPLSSADQAQATSLLRNLATLAPRPPAARRTGRFMDVIHPSSTMKPATPTPTASPEASKPAPEGEPTSRKAAFDTSPVKEEDAPQSPTDASSLALPNSKNNWPDPVDLTSPEPVDTVSDEVPKEPEPSYSPFLLDAKVEKRPLGSPMSSGPVNDDTTPEDESAQLPAEAKEVDRALPDELHSDLLAIEAGTARHSEGELNQVIETPTSEPKKSEDFRVRPVESKPEYTGPTSIPQQYKEEPATVKLENGAIYDTDTYHQPLTHPVRKKSGWLVVVWILLILIVGAGVGAAFYLFWR